MWQGGVVLGLLVGVVIWAMHAGIDEAGVRSIAFAGLVATNLALIPCGRSVSAPMWRVLAMPNPVMWWVSGGALTCLVSVLALPGLREIFRFGALGAREFTVVALVGAASVVLLQVSKQIARWRAHARDAHPARR